MSQIEIPPTESAVPIAEKAPIKASRQRSLLTRLALILGLVVLGLIAWLFWESPAEKDFRHAVDLLFSVTAGSGETGVPATASIQVNKGNGLRKALANLHLQVAIAAPQRI